ncbi:uncharacterized protein LOC120255822 [Dioscorea cayenensis subsp. rotundata]|uniref:Uncharacterized protein LOC120255822 n=1 Tax=Dioscorea cayennensis subsp. rotundata TaxID=55577 RepID=A0AB40AWW8_DIOCR|nr:uncharacterized protein LOC120255822 [Dioscorea cayenensis subsp. rotundata]
MGFEDVLAALVEICPQVDYCMLQAVASQHSEDVNAALDFILHDVLPSSTASWTPCSSNSSDWGHQGVEEAHAHWPSESGLLSSGIACNSDFQVNDRMTCMDKPVGRDTEYETKTNGMGYPTNSTEANSNMHLKERFVEFGVCLPSDHTNDFKVNSTNETLSGSDLQEVSACSAGPTSIHDNSAMQDKYTGTATSNGAQDPFASILNKSIEHLKEFPSQREIENDDNLSSQGDIGSFDVNGQSSTIASGIDLFEGIKYLEDLTIDAKNSKVILTSAMESTINMEKEVELHEERAKQAKIEASLAGEDTLVHVEELQCRLKLEKERNDMHAEEVHGERSMLAAEAQGLQSWLLSVSNERDKSLGIIDEIRNTLETRLASAKAEIAAAEEEAFEKKVLALKALADGRLFAVSIFEEKEKLQQEAEENLKLKEALMNHGQIIDILRLEIASILKDVMTLKERVDGHIPLSRSASRVSVTSNPVSLSTELSDSQIAPSEGTSRNPHSDGVSVSSSQLGDMSFSTLSATSSTTSDAVSPDTELPDCQIVNEEVTLKSSRLLSKININEVPSDDEESLKSLRLESNIININEVPFDDEETLKTPHSQSKTININEVPSDDEETPKSPDSESKIININAVPFDEEETPKSPHSESRININEVPSDDDNNIVDMDDWEFLGEFYVKPTAPEMAA